MSIVITANNPLPSLDELHPQYEAEQRLLNDTLTEYETSLRWAMREEWPNVDLRFTRHPDQPASVNMACEDGVERQADMALVHFIIAADRLYTGRKLHLLGL